MAELAAIFRTRTRDEWVAELGDADVCVGPVNSITEALDDPQLRERGVSAPLDYGLGEGIAGALRSAPTMNSVPFLPPRRLPALGDHTADALPQAGYPTAES